MYGLWSLRIFTPLNRGFSCGTLVSKPKLGDSTERDVLVPQKARPFKTTIQRETHRTTRHQHLPRFNGSFYVFKGQGTPWEVLAMAFCLFSLGRNLFGSFSTPRRDTLRFLMREILSGWVALQRVQGLVG